MATAQPPIDQNVLVGLRQGDERSLEQLFRDRYESLVQEATTQLDDARGAAPRVVEHAFIQVWDERGRFDTRQGLETFLHAAVREGAARERKRLATLHRMEDRAHVRVAHHETKPPTVDEAWSYVGSALHATPADRVAAAHARAQQSRHGAAEHVASIGKRKIPWAMLGIGAAVAALVAAPLYWAENTSTDAAVTRALASPNVRLINTLTGQRASVELLDGSRAAVGGDTKMVIAPDFGATVRALRLEGAALFTVAPGQKHAFQVRAGNATVTATGTAFGVHAYPGDETITVGTKEGSVRVKAGGETRDVAAGRGLVVSNNGTMRDASAAELDEALAWNEGRFVVANRPLRHAVKAMARWYSMDIKVRDSTLLNRTVTVAASLDSPRDAIAALERSGSVAFGYEGQTMVLRDGASGASSKR